jgi:hypothetical protein
MNKKENKFIAKNRTVLHLFTIWGNFYIYIKEKVDHDYHYNTNICENEVQANYYYFFKKKKERKKEKN